MAQAADSAVGRVAQSFASGAAADRENRRGDDLTNHQRIPIGGPAEESAVDPRIAIATNMSIVANFLLFGCNATVAAITGSLAIFASAVDSFLDIASQVVVYLAMRANRNVDREKWPVGRSRLEPLGVLVVASMMSVAALFVVVQALIRLATSAQSIANKAEPQRPVIDTVMLSLFVSAISVKVFLFLYCVRFRHLSSMCAVLAEDHRNDVLSNSTALVTAYIASLYVEVWWLDAVGGLLIALYIAWRWFTVGHVQAGLLVGKAATADFVAQVKAIADAHDPTMVVDVLRAYHFGSRFVVEVEVVMPIDTTLDVVHDKSLALQKRIEELDVVERAHVHVDYEFRQFEEHKIIGSFRLLRHSNSSEDNNGIMALPFSSSSETPLEVTGTASPHDVHRRRSLPAGRFVSGEREAEVPSA